jgi:hypothetical protein
MKGKIYSAKPEGYILRCAVGNGACNMFFEGDFTLIEVFVTRAGYEKATFLTVVNGIVEYSCGGLEIVELDGFEIVPYAVPEVKKT